MKDKVKNALRKMQLLNIEAMDKANKCLLQKKTEEFIKHQTEYETIQKCIDILNTETEK
jgi:hypothetical protein